MSEGVVVAYWWVNHKRTWRSETSKGFLWAPKKNANYSANQSYTNLTRAAPGDIVFSYANGWIRHIGVVEFRAVTAGKPNYGGVTPWGNEGWLLPVKFKEISQAVRPRDHIDSIRPFLPARHSPIQANGKGNLSYLSELSASLGDLLMEVAGLSTRQIQLDMDEILPDLKAIDTDSAVGPTERLMLSKARIGQGLFRDNVLAVECACRVTGVSEPALLRASHIKPWRLSTNVERLDGNNGLMLAPHVDLLFDKHLISFERDGELLISPRLSSAVILHWHISEPLLLKPFTNAQESYMAKHRSLLQ